MDQEATIVIDLRTRSFLTPMILKRGGIFRRELTGKPETIDDQNGTRFIEEKNSQRKGGNTDLVYFVFDPRNIEEMISSGVEAERSVLDPCDIAKAEYWGAGLREARQSPQACLSGSVPRCGPRRQKRP